MQDESSLSVRSSDRNCGEKRKVRLAHTHTYAVTYETAAITNANGKQLKISTQTQLDYSILAIRYTCISYLQNSEKCVYKQKQQINEIRKKGNKQNASIILF